MESLGPILIVEDEPALCDFLAMVLGSLYSVTCVSSAEKAFQLIENSPPAVVLCDATLPRISGLEFIERLRDNPMSSGIPVVLMSGSVEDIEEHGRAAGAAAFLSKPFHIPQILGAISNFVQRPCRAAELASHA